MVNEYVFSEKIVVPNKISFGWHGLTIRSSIDEIRCFLVLVSVEQHSRLPSSKESKINKWENIW